MIQVFWGQVFMDLREGGDRDHQVLIRPKNPSIATDSFQLVAPGREKFFPLEDCCWMRSVIMVANDIRCNWYQLPLDDWEITLDLQWEIAYPFVRYNHDDKKAQWRNKTTGFLGNSNKASHHMTGVVFMNPTHRSVCLFAMSPEHFNEYMKIQELDEEERLSSDWKPRLELIHEFSPFPLPNVDLDR